MIVFHYTLHFNKSYKYLNKNTIKIRKSFCLLWYLIMIFLSESIQNIFKNPYKIILNVKKYFSENSLNFGMFYDFTFISIDSQK